MILSDCLKKQITFAKVIKLIFFFSPWKQPREKESRQCRCHVSLFASTFQEFARNKCLVLSCHLEPHSSNILFQLFLASTETTYLTKGFSTFWRWTAMFGLFDRIYLKELLQFGLVNLYCALNWMACSLVQLSRFFKI